MKTLLKSIGTILKSIMAFGDLWGGGSILFSFILAFVAGWDDLLQRPMLYMMLVNGALLIEVVAFLFYKERRIHKGEEKLHGKLYYAIVALIFFALALSGELVIVRLYLGYVSVEPVMIQYLLEKKIILTLILTFWLSLLPVLWSSFGMRRRVLKYLQKYYKTRIEELPGKKDDELKRHKKKMKYYSKLANIKVEPVVELSLQRKIIKCINTNDCSSKKKCAELLGEDVNRVGKAMDALRAQGIIDFTSRQWCVVDRATRKRQRTNLTASSTQETNNPTEAQTAEVEIQYPFETTPLEKMILDYIGALPTISRRNCAKELDGRKFMNYAEVTVAKKSEVEAAINKMERTGRLYRKKGRWQIKN